MQFKVVIFTDSQNLYQQRQKLFASMGYPAGNVLWGDSSKFSRLDIFHQNQGERLCFLDHDCWLSAETLDTINRIFSEQPGDFVSAGLYENPPVAHALQKVHNLIANGWLEHSHLKGNRGFLLGGIFLARVSAALPQASGKLFWGAEDKALAQLFHDAGIRIFFEPQLRVTHETSSSVFHFVRRAWLHGVNEVKYTKNSGTKINFLYWLRKAGFANLNLMPLVLLHFCIQKTALLFQTVRQVNK
jgi:hypothetical protein